MREKDGENKCWALVSFAREVDAFQAVELAQQSAAAWAASGPIEAVSTPHGERNAAVVAEQHGLQRRWMRVRVALRPIPASERDGRDSPFELLHEHIFLSCVLEVGHRPHAEIAQRRPSTRIQLEM